MVAEDAQAVEQDFDVWEENLPALTVFWECRTQWRYLAGRETAVITGLEYASVTAAMPYLVDAAADRNAVFAGVRAMERGALEVFNAPGGAS